MFAVMMISLRIPSALYVLTFPDAPVTALIEAVLVSL
jgi:hypothetical protein